MPTGPRSDRVSRWLSRRQAIGSVACGLLSLFISSHPVSAAELWVQLRPEQVKQGGLSVLEVAGALPLRGIQVWFGAHELLAVPLHAERRAALLVGVDLEERPGRVPIRVEAEAEGGRRLTAQADLEVQDGRYSVQRLTLPRPFVELDAATLERVSREKAVLDHLWEGQTPARYWRGPFRLPLEGAPSGFGFGVRRVINGEPRAPHTGEDFAAAAGAPVLAANAGSVALVADQFFAGKLVVLDHGLGLFSMYFHLAESLVAAGEQVTRGQVIGRVGSTGRATGPHLHWGVRLHGARIDPEALLRVSLPTPE